MNQHPPGQHLSSCTSPENCEEYRSILSMTATQHAAWILQDRARLRTASARTGQLRVQIRREENFTPPDPYARGIALLREAEATPESRFAELYTANRLRQFKDEYAAAAPVNARRVMSAQELQQYTPPNPYVKETR